MAKYSLKYKVGLLAGAGEMSAESSSKMSDGRNLDMLLDLLWASWRRLSMSRSGKHPE